MNRSTYVILKWVLIVLVAGGLLALATKLALGGFLPWVIGIAFLAMCVLVVYGPRRGVPAKYLFPGLIFMLCLQVFPIVLTVATSFTNYGDGHQVSKQESVDTLIAQSVQEVPGSPRYALSVAVRENADPLTGDPYYLLTDPTTKQSYVGDAKGLIRPARGGSHQDRDRQDHRRPGLHDPQRPPGQRPARPQDLRRTHRRRRRDQGGRPLRGVRREADPLVRRGDRHHHRLGHRQQVRPQERHLGQRQR